MKKTIIPASNRIARPRVSVPAEGGGHAFGYFLFMIYTVSFFFRLPERFSVLGALRFDFILGSVLLAFSFFRIFSQKQNRNGGEPLATWMLAAIIGYIILTLPFVEWPGTVLRLGLIDFLKSAVFYIFAIAFIKDQKQLKNYVFLYFASLLFIVLEPLYLYLSQGRLGYVDYSMGEVGFSRLSGATNKVGGNPNGLASVIAISIPFIFFYYKYYTSRFFKLLLVSLVPVLLYALVLTGSRSGLLATITAVIVCALKSKAKVLNIIIILLIAIGILTQLGGIHKQRYETLVDKNIEGRGGVDGRVEHIRRGLSIFADRPIVGYGIGTYKEANYNVNGEDLVSHNFYIGVLVELGIIGFILYFLFITGIFKNIYRIKKAHLARPPEDRYLAVLADLLESILITQLVFSIFAGGPSYYIWFLLAGVTIVALKFTNEPIISNYKPYSPAKLSAQLK